MSCGCDIDLTLCLPVGTSPIWGFTVTDPDNAGAAINITGATFAFYVKEAPGDLDADAVITYTSADSEIVIITAASGTAQIINDAAKTALPTAGTPYYWKLVATFTSGEVRVIRSGFLNAESK